jgi:RNA polymerase sigma factor (sigma-70 family)
MSPRRRCFASGVHARAENPRTIPSRGRSGRRIGSPWTGIGRQRRWLAFLGRQPSARADASEARDELLAVWAEVDRLPERQRQVLYLRYRADLSFEDIGRVLGIGTSSARSNASRGIASLRDRLSGRDQ